MIILKTVNKAWLIYGASSTHTHTPHATERYPRYVLSTEL